MEQIGSRGLFSVSFLKVQMPSGSSAPGVCAVCSPYVMFLLSTLLPWPCFPQLCPVHGFCHRKAALCSTLLPVCHFISIVFLLPSASLPPPVSGFESLCKGVWKTFLGSSSGISSTNRLEREFLWHKTNVNPQGLSVREDAEVGSHQ